MNPTVAKIKVLTITLMFLAIALAGCSNQWREVNFDMDYQEVQQLFDEIQTSLESQPSSAKDTFFALVEDPNATVYFADGPSEFGNVINVLSIIRYDFLGDQLAGLTFWDIQQVSVAFVYVPTEGGDQCALMVDITPAGSENAITRFYECYAAGVDDGEFVAELIDINDVRIVLRSFDVSDGFLKDIIQLRVSDFDANGDEQPNGKFSTLIGFGP